MWRTFVVVALISLVTTSINGCAMIQPGAEPDRHDASKSSPDQQVLNNLEAEVFLLASTGSREKLDLQQLNPGQHVQLITGSKRSASSGDALILDSAVMAGTVKELVGDSVVLSDLILFNEYRSTTSTPILRKVPYLSRLFQNTFVARTRTPIPGEITIEKSEILHANDLTEAEFLAFPKTGGHERIGIDLDFDIPSATDEPAPTVSVSR